MHRGGKSVNKSISFIGRAFEFNSEKIILTLYNSLVLPYLEYCVSFWSPYYNKNIHKVDQIQRRITKIIPRLPNKLYDERLKELNLLSLTKHRWRGDLTVLKMFKEFANLQLDDNYTIDRSSIIRNNEFKIIDKRLRTNQTKYFFFNRVVNIWNGLPSNVVNSSTI